jgi:hypothetical protein
MKKVGVYFEQGGKHYKTIMPIMKMLKKGLYHNKVAQDTFSKEEFVEVFNSIVAGCYRLNETGLTKTDVDGEDPNEVFKITVDNVYVNEEVDKFLDEHLKTLANGHQYITADLKFFYIDVKDWKLERV